MSDHEATGTFFDVVDESAQAAAALTEQERADCEWSELMATAGNRARIWELFERGLLFQSIADTDAMRLMQRAAVRDFALSLRKTLHRVCPDQLALAEREANDRPK